MALIGGLAKSRQNRRGSATVEFAVLLPVLVTIGLLCVDFGRFAHHYTAVTNAARVGAALGSVTPVTDVTYRAWSQEIRQAVVDELSGNAWFEEANLVMPRPQSINENDGMRRVRVEVRYPFETVLRWPFLPDYNKRVILKRVVIMRGIR